MRLRCDYDVSDTEKQRETVTDYPLCWTVG